MTSIISKVRLVVILLLIINSHIIIGQSFGIRAGLNFTEFNGPTSDKEQYKLTSGFHFGINFGFSVAENLSLRSEILYTQVGTEYNFVGSSIYRIPIGNAFLAEEGLTKMNIKVSNAYISLPLVMSWQMNKKIELNAGIYAQFLVGPRGSGILDFDSYAHPEEIFFTQSLIHNYFQDRPRAASSNNSGPTIIVGNDQKITLARDAGAYYNLRQNEKIGNLFRSFDFGLTGGLSYFINKGFYVGLRYDIGLIDVTNDKVDYIRDEYDFENNKFIKSTDKDVNAGFQCSFGFRF